MGRHIAALRLLLTGCAWVLAHIAASQCDGVTFASSSSQWDILGTFFNDIWDSGAIAQLHQLPAVYITYAACTFIQISCLVNPVQSTWSTLFYQHYLLLKFLTCKSLPSSTLWSQYLITLIIFITQPGSYLQCTYIVIHRKFSNWDHLLFDSPATLPTSPESHAFLSSASNPLQSFSFLIDPLLQLSSLQGLSFEPSLFLQSSLFFSYLILYAEDALLHQNKLSVLSFLQSTCHKIYKIMYQNESEKQYICDKSLWKEMFHLHI